MPETWLPLFPLNVVLFPHSSLPLHIFEERYKTLVNECLGRGTSFGITLTRDSGVAGIGCSARISSVLRRFDDGRMDIVVKGGQRFRLLRCEAERAPYLLGEVDYVDDPAETLDRALATDTVRMFNTLVTMAFKGEVGTLGANMAERGLSFLIAQKAGLDLDHRQQLLEMMSENERLRTLHVYLKDLLPRLRHLEDIERVVKNDGYL